MESKKVQVISCKCGAVYAGCVDGYQDAQWGKEVAEAVIKGHSVALQDKCNWGKCTCEQAPKAEQTSLF